MMGWWKADPISEDEPSQSSSITASPPITSPVDTCPVDPKARSIWLRQAQAQAPQKHDDLAPKAPHPLPPGTEASECPVDPKTREVWLKAAQGKKQVRAQENVAERKAPMQTLGQAPQECSSDTINQSPVSAYPIPAENTYALPEGFRPLSHDRVVSSIPRASAQPPVDNSPSNAEIETGASNSGNWIYPSESQFFQAVLRKHNVPSSTSSTSDLASTVPSIIPIHNAVNERAWTMIKKWEGDSSKACGGPKLLSFSGLGAGPDDQEGIFGGIITYARLMDPTTCLSPRARWRGLVGYQVPFDRHDWVVERCDGRKVEYVIDFYQGRNTNGQAQEGDRGASNAFGGGVLNFYLDVRPKLNSVDGWKMRTARFWGW